MKNSFSTKKNLKPIFFVSLIFLTAALTNLPEAKADNINEQLNNMFGSMSNVTNPGDYRSVTREGYTGGGFTLRSKLRSLAPINVQLPSAAGGCGGIDLFGGSFSFINADEFVQMLRNIAANAGGLAFQIALNAMDAVLDNAISRMQAVVQQMNDLTANSCQLAKGLLVDTASAFGEQAKASVASQLSSTGLTDQFTAYMGGSNGKKVSVAQKEESGKREGCKDYGNLMWCLLSNGQFTSQFLGSEQVQKEFVMSLTGSWIIGKDISTDDTGALIGGAPHDITPLSSSDALDALINGNADYKMYRCTDTANCLNPDTQSIDIKGLAQVITKFFNDDGYLQAISQGTQLSTTQMEKANFYNTNGASSTAATLARHDLNMAKSYINEIAPVLAYGAANQYINQLLVAAATGARIEIDNSNPAAPYFEKCLEKIANAQTSLQTSYLAASTQYGGVSKIIDLKVKYMQALPTTHFAKDQEPLSAQ